jgi:hypothetical protein
MDMHSKPCRDSLSVTDVLARTTAEGQAIRPHWSDDDLDANGRAALTTEEWPTAELPVIHPTTGRHTYVIHEPAAQGQQQPSGEARRLTNDRHQGESSE